MKKSMKKLPILLATLSLLSSVALGAPAPEDDFRFSAGTAGGTIMDYLGAGGAVEVPATIQGEAVAVIFTQAFAQKNNISSLILPDSITQIYQYAFQGNGGLSYVDVGSGVTEIASGVFYNCADLTSITLPKNLKEIGASAFFGCNNLSTVYYGGDDSDRAKIVVKSNNQALENANWVYMSEGPSTQAPTPPAEPEISPEDEGNDSTAPEGDGSPAPDDNGLIYDSWATGIVSSARENNLLVGSLSLDLRTDINRHQIAHLLVNLVEQSTQTTLDTAAEDTFPDTNEVNILKAYQAGLIGGKTDGTFDPFAPATRQEISIMVYNTIKLLESTTDKILIAHNLTDVSGFGDFDSTATWAQDSMAILVNNQIMGGDNNGNLLPLANTRIQECLVLVNNLFGLG